LACFAYDLCKAEQEVPQHKYTHPQSVRDVFDWNWPNIDWEQPDKIFIEQEYIDRTFLKLTVKEALCYAYNLKPNE
jgi:hypothetical protein